MRMNNATSAAWGIFYVKIFNLNIDPLLTLAIPSSWAKGGFSIVWP